MANVDTDNGWLKVANELAEALYKTSFTSREFRLTWWLIRNSYGRKGSKSAVNPGIRKIGKEIGMDYSDIAKTVNQLIRAGVLVREDGRFFLIKDFDKWCVGKVPTGVKYPRNRGQTTHGIVGKVPTDSYIKERKKERQLPRTGRGGDSRVPVLISIFYGVLKAKLGEPPVFSKGAAGAGMKRLLQHHDQEAILERMKSWFDSEDEFIQRNAWRAEQFFRFFNTLKDGPIRRRENDWTAKREKSYQEERKKREDLDARADELIKRGNAHRK